MLLPCAKNNCMCKIGNRWGPAYSALTTMFLNLTQSKPTVLCNQYTLYIQNWLAVKSCLFICLFYFLYLFFVLYFNLLFYWYLFFFVRWLWVLKRHPQIKCIINIIIITCCHCNKYCSLMINDIRIRKKRMVTCGCSAMVLTGGFTLSASCWISEGFFRACLKLFKPLWTLSLMSLSVGLILVKL